MPALTALIYGAILAGTQGNGQVAGVPERKIEVLVATLRHRREEFAAPITTFEALRKRYEPLGYELFRKESKVLAVDRAVFARLPNVAQARLLDYFAEREFKASRVSDLPDGVREAVVDRMLATLPDQTREGALASSFEMRASAPFRVAPPPRMGAARTYEAIPTTLPQPTTSRPSIGPAFPSLDARAGVSELRLFLPDRESQNAVLGLWDELRPLMKAREEEYSKNAFDRVNEIRVGARRWLESQLGAKRGESVKYGSLSAAQKASLGQASGLRPADLEGASITIEPGSIQIEFGSGGDGSVVMPIYGILP